MLTGPVRGALEGEGRYADKVYFFKGDRYWRYDLKKDYGEVDYPRSLTEWKLPTEFAAGIDGCLAGQGRYVDKAYFFKGPWYVSYDWKTDLVSERRLIASWDGLHAFPFPGGIDAALTGRGKYPGKSYFFKGGSYARYDWEHDRIDLKDQKVSAWRLGPGFDSDITACLSVDGDRDSPEPNWMVEVNADPVAYFFKGNEYVKYDWKQDRGLPGYPLPIDAGWPTGCAVWASHSQAPTNVCPDPRLDAGRTVLAYPAGHLGGQAGWQATLSFTTISSLADKLSALVIPDYYGDDNAGKGVIPPRRITRLCLNAHGGGGIFAANGPNAMMNQDQQLNDGTVLSTKPEGEELRRDLRRIERTLAPGASILLLGCNVAQTSTGGYFLMGLSLVLKDHPISGMTTIGYAGGPRSSRGSEGCSEAGMRDTSFYRSSPDWNEEGRRVAQNWGDLNEWPWASEVSTHAKTALNGEIVRTPDGDYP